ncbi:hypothetical protein SAMN06265349_101635 [Flavobacterium resistens]|uniref:Lipoprotein n=1 Tax=Flavobacterium resistens TaxID=443612 RepID=A0A521B349_9FLAO|nr:hypothetical protein [Flavobacterium resistens]MRX70339.1 hypothetical protein [Flavobacterium resistens]SMO41512.1 hypothetical protein SAMN06265349_101635 [Flavobacterium resistens]
MKQIIKLSFIFLFITTLGCDNAVDCTTPPVSLNFEFVDVDSGQNLFTNGAFDSKKAITVTDLDTNKIIQTAYMKTDELNRLVINSIGFEVGTFNYGIRYDDKNIFELHVTTEKIKDNHCSGTKIRSIEIKNASYRFDDKTGSYKILFKAG